MKMFDPHPLHPFSTLVDGGYFSFAYGCRSRDAWDSIRHLHSHTLFLMDRKSYRAKFFEDYRARRKVKRNQQMYDEVREFRSYLWDHESLIHAAAVEGAEADDLVALFFMANKKHYRQVIAVDKDLYQIPDLRDRMVNIQYESSSEGRTVMRKPPSYIIENYVRPWTSGEMVFLQALLGDKSDSIPRLIPSRNPARGEVWEELHPRGSTLAERFIIAAELFGNQFWINVELAAIPGNLLRDEPFEDGEEWARSLEDGTYWTPEEWSYLYQQAIDSLHERRDSFETDWSDIIR